MTHFARIRILALVSFVLLGTLAVAQEPQDGGTLTIATRMEVVTLDAGRTNDRASRNALDQVYDTLVRDDFDYEPIPHLATDWDVSDDATEWTFELRDDVTFHDGSPLTADDVVFSFDRILNESQAVSGQLSKVSMIDTVEAVDDHTVRFTLDFPYAPFLGAAKQIRIVPQAVVEEVGEDAFARDPVGSGPFRFVSWDRDEELVFERNEDYFLGTPHIERLVFRPIPDSTSAALALIAGEVDVVDQLAEPMVDQVRRSGQEVEIVEGMNYAYLGFRQYGGFYEDRRFREMVYRAVDWDAAVENVMGEYGGVRAETIVPPGLWPRDDEHIAQNVPEYDPEAARELFEELVDDGTMDRDDEVDVHIWDDPLRLPLSEIVVTALRDIGVNAELRTSEWTAFLDDVIDGDDSQIFMLGGAPAMPDPDIIFHFLYAADSNEGGNVLGMKNVEDETRDRLIQEARSETDQEVREELYTELQRHLLVDELYHVPLYHRNIIWGMSPDVRDLPVWPTEHYTFITRDHNTWLDR